MLSISKRLIRDNFFLIGSTPIVPVLREILRDKHHQIHERKLLILLATDGVPTDEDEHPDINTLKEVLTYERIPTDRVPVTIIACTGESTSERYFHSLDPCQAIQKSVFAFICRRRRVHGISE
jgi:hypothetical protein